MVAISYLLQCNNFRSAMEAGRTSRHSVAWKKGINLGFEEKTSVKKKRMSKGEKDMRCVCEKLSMCRGYAEEGAKPKDSRVHPSIGAPRGKIVV